MASPTQWTWVWATSGTWWWTGRPSVLQSMGSQRVGHDWVTELNWTELKVPSIINLWIYFFFFWQCCEACRILVPWPGIKTVPLKWKSRLLTPGPPGNSLSLWKLRGESDQWKAGLPTSLDLSQASFRKSTRGNVLPRLVYLLEEGQFRVRISPTGLPKPQGEA